MHTKPCEPGLKSLKNAVEAGISPTCGNRVQLACQTAANDRPCQSANDRMPGTVAAAWLGRPGVGPQAAGVVNDAVVV